MLPNSYLNIYLCCFYFLANICQVCLIWFWIVFHFCLPTLHSDLCSSLHLITVWLTLPIKWPASAGIRIGAKFSPAWITANTPEISYDWKIKTRLFAKLMSFDDGNIHYGRRSLFCFHLFATKKKKKCFISMQNMQHVELPIGFVFIFVFVIVIVFILKLEWIPEVWRCWTFIGPSALVAWPHTCRALHTDTAPA